jgi:hypothetical protein
MRKPQTTSPPTRKYSTLLGPWAKSDKEKADLFAEHLSEVFSPHNNDQDQEVEQDLATPIQSQERLKVYTLKEIKDEIKMLNHKKAPGFNLITARMLKELPKEGLVNLMYIFSAILRLKYWPKSLKIKQKIMIPKPGKNPTDVSSYCPISLLPTISKVLQKPTLKKINKDLNPQAWIPNHQSGLTGPLHSATMPPHNRYHQ